MCSGLPRCVSVLLLCCIYVLYVCVVGVSETDISQRFDGGSPHLSWDHPFYDIARHQIIEVAGQSSQTFLGDWLGFDSSLLSHL